MYEPISGRTYTGIQCSICADTRASGAPMNFKALRLTGYIRYAEQAKQQKKT